MTIPWAQLGKLDLEQKANVIQQFYQDHIFHENGIMYSLMKIDKGQIRPFQPKDFIGKETKTFSGWRYKPAGGWEYLNNENSITTSGIYLASQVYRYLATGDNLALEQAAKAFQSLKLIYDMGVEDGRAGWMGKPYGFRISDQTSGDQYLDAAWGLYAYHEIAPENHKSIIEEMLVAFADYWYSVDYKLDYFGSYWDMKGNQHSYNLIMIMLLMIAYRFTGKSVYKQEARFFMEQARWHIENPLEKWKNLFTQGKKMEWKFDKLVQGHLQEGEHLCWETTIHSKFVAVAAEIVHKIDPDFLNDQLLSTTISKWWSMWHVGIDDDYLPYYFFIYDVVRDTWRPAPRTERLPLEERPFGHPFLSYCSHVRWTEPLTRTMMASVIAVSHAGEIAGEAKEVALNMMHKLDDIRMRWQYDPDGNQIIPELDYMNSVLSSEMPATYLASFWRGRHEKLW